MKINKRSLQAAKEKIICEKTKEITIKCCFYAMLLVLNGLEGFGKTRLQRVLDEFTKTLWDYQDRYGEVMLEALEDHVKQRKIEVHWR